MQDERMMPRWGKVVLVISLTLNLLVVGVIAGAAWRFAGGPPHHRPPDGALQLVFALPHSAREALRAGIMEHHRPVSGRDGPAMQQELQDILRASPFDADALDAHLAERTRRDAARLQAGRAALVAQIAAMSDQERTEYADRLNRRGRWHH